MTSPICALRGAVVAVLLLATSFGGEVQEITMDQVVQKQKAANRSIAEEIKTALLQADKIELVSLDPVVSLAANGQPNNHHQARYGFALLGTANTKEMGEAKTLAEAMNAAILSSNGEQALCFDPRHALRITGKKESIDVVICFMCSQGYLQKSGEQRWFTITKQAESVFDAVFATHGLKKAPVFKATTTTTLPAK